MCFCCKGKSMINNRSKIKENECCGCDMCECELDCCSCDSDCGIY